jgi:hypothetical protein
MAEKGGISQGKSAAESFNAAAEGARTYLVYSAEAAREFGSSQALVRGPDGSEKIVEYTASFNKKSEYGFADATMAWKAPAQSVLRDLGPVEQCFMMYSPKDAAERGVNVATVTEPDGAKRQVMYTDIAPTLKAAEAMMTANPEAKPVWDGAAARYQVVASINADTLLYSREAALESGASQALVRQPDGSQKMVEYTAIATSPKEIAEYKKNAPDAREVAKALESDIQPVRPVEAVTLMYSREAALESGSSFAFVAGKGLVEYTAMLSKPEEISIYKKGAPDAREIGRVMETEVQHNHVSSPATNAAIMEARRVMAMPVEIRAAPEAKPLTLRDLPTAARPVSPQA